MQNIGNVTLCCMIKKIHFFCTVSLPYRDSNMPIRNFHTAFGFEILLLQEELIINRSFRD